MANSKDVAKLQPGATYHAVIAYPSDDNGSAPKSIAYTFTVPTNVGGSVIQSNNTAVENYVSGSGAIVSGSNGGPSNPINTMFIDGDGLKAFNNSGASTVYISSIDGTAYFSGSVIATSGSIGGFSITDNQLYASVSGPKFTGLKPSSYPFFSGASAQDGLGALFYVDTAGGLYAQSASIKGTLYAGSTFQAGNFTAYSASIQGMTITGGLISQGTISGASINVPATLPLFTVDSSGNMVAQSASINGKITAIEGAIAGWSINNQELYKNPVGQSNHIALNSDPTNPKIYIGQGNHASQDTGFYVDSTGRFSLSNQLYFTPGKGSAQSSSTVASTNITSYQITTTIDNSSGSVLYKGILAMGPDLDIDTYVSSVTNTNPAIVILSKYPLNTNATSSITFKADDFSQLTVTGKIKGEVESITPIQSPKLFSTITSASVGVGGSVVIFGTNGHSFISGEHLILQGLPTSGSLSNLNYTASSGNSYSIISASNSSSFSISTPTSASLIAGNYSSISGSVSIQELTMGLHPSEGYAGSSIGDLNRDSWYHDSGIGIRLDKYNWWFTNNQFRVGTDQTSFKWDGSKFKIKGGGLYTLEMSVGAEDSNNYFAIYNPSAITGYNNTYSNVYYNNFPLFNDYNTPFYVDATGKFSLGNQLTWTPSSSTLIVKGSGSFSGNITATSGSIGGFNITNSSLYGGTGTNYTGMIPNTYPLFAGADNGNGLNSNFYVDNVGRVVLSGTVGSTSKATLKVINKLQYIPTEYTTFLIDSGYDGSQTYPLNNNFYPRFINIALSYIEPTFSTKADFLITASTTNISSYLSNSMIGSDTNINHLFYDSVFDFTYLLGRSDNSNAAGKPGVTSYTLYNRPETFSFADQSVGGYSVGNATLSLRENYVINPSFEAGTSGYTFAQAASAISITNLSPFNTGGEITPNTSAIRIRTTSTTDNNVLYQYVVIPSVAVPSYSSSPIYTYSAYFRVTASTTGASTASTYAIGLFDETNDPIPNRIILGQTVTPALGTGSWQRATLTVQYTDSTANTSRVIVARYLNNSRNLMKNPSFETGTTANWTIGSGLTASAVSGSGYDGTYALQLIKNSVGGGNIYFITQNTYISSLIQSTDYTFSFYAKRVSGNNPILINYSFYSVGGINGGYVLGAASVTDSWQRFSLTIPASAVVAGFGTTYINMPDNAGTTNDTILIDAVMVQPGSSANTFTNNTVVGTDLTFESDAWLAERGENVQSYFDGNTQFDPTNSACPSWVGTAHLSQSYNNAYSVNGFTYATNVTTGSVTIGSNTISGVFNTQNLAIGEYVNARSGYAGIALFPMGTYLTGTSSGVLTLSNNAIGTSTNAYIYHQSKIIGTFTAGSSSVTNVKEILYVPKWLNGTGASAYYKTGFDNSSYITKFIKYGKLEVYDIANSAYFSSSGTNFLIKSNTASSGLITLNTTANVSYVDKEIRPRNRQEDLYLSGGVVHITNTLNQPASNYGSHYDPRKNSISLFVEENNNHGIRMGQINDIATTPYIDFISQGGLFNTTYNAYNDYDARIIVSGGDGSGDDGTANVSVIANSLKLNSTVLGGSKPVVVGNKTTNQNIIAGQKTITPGTLISGGAASVSFSESNGYYAVITQTSLPGQSQWLKFAIATSGGNNYLYAYNLSASTINFNYVVYVNYIGLSVS